jgi:O-antigen ligase
VAILFAFLFSRPVRPWGFLGLGLILALLALAPFVLDTLIQRFTDGEGEGDLGGRDRLWEASLLLLRDAPWTGVGVGNGPFELHDYIAALTSAANHRRDLPSHQPFLEIGVETGLFGLLIYAGIILSAVWSFVRSRPLWRAAGGAAAAYHPIVGGVAVGYSLSWFKSGGMENHLSFFILLALMVVPGQIARDAGAARSSPGGGPRPERPRAAGPSTVPTGSSR